MVRRPSRRAYAAQWLLLLAVLAVADLVVANATDNLSRRNLSFGFGFLADRANFDIPFHVISWTKSDSYRRALLVSFVNTLLVSAMGIVAATGLGLLIGIMRLSVNWLIRNLALVYIEFVRNTPLLVQIIFWYFAVLQTLPAAAPEHRHPGRVAAQYPRPLRAERRHGRPGFDPLPAFRRGPGPDASGLAAAAEGRAPGREGPAPAARRGRAVRGRDRAHRVPDADRLQHHRGRPDPARARGAVGRTVDLFRGLHRRDRAQRYRGGAEGPARGRPRARSLHAGACCSW